MVFEIGKSYLHSTGKKMSIVGEAHTSTWGRCFVGETDDGNLIPVGMTEENTLGWEEIITCPCGNTFVKEPSKREFDYIQKTYYIRCPKCNHPNYDF